jgi:hypothetical protein
MVATLDHAEQTLKADKPQEVKVDLAKTADGTKADFNQAHSEAKAGSLAGAQNTVDKHFGAGADLLSGTDTKPLAGAQDKSSDKPSDSTTTVDKATGSVRTEAHDKDNNKTVLDTNKDGSYQLVTSNAEGKETHFQAMDSEGNTTNRETDAKSGNFTETKIEAKTGNTTITKHDEAAGTDESTTTDADKNVLQTKSWNKNTGYDSTTTFDKETGSTHTEAFDKDNNKTVSDEKRDGSYSDVTTNDQGQEIHSESKDSAGNVTSKDTDAATGDYTKTEMKAESGITTITKHDEASGHDDIQNIGKARKNNHGQSQGFEQGALFPTLKPGGGQESAADNAPKASAKAMFDVAPTTNETPAQGVAGKAMFDVAPTANETPAQGVAGKAMFDVASTASETPAPEATSPDRSTVQKQFDQDKAGSVDETQKFTAKANMDLSVAPNVAGESTIKAAQEAILNGDSRALGKELHNFKGNINSVAEEMNKDFQKEGAKTRINVSDDGQVQIQDFSGKGAYDVSVVAALRLT